MFPMARPSVPSDVPRPKCSRGVSQGYPFTFLAARNMVYLALKNGVGVSVQSGIH